ncbi:MAG: Peptidase S8 protein [Anaerolineales bacterium]|nr:Peptidase S8 protein [Anaerolineales bacterium]
MNKAIKQSLSRLGLVALLTLLLLRQAVFASVSAQDNGTPPPPTRRTPSFDVPYVDDEVVVKFSPRASAKAVQHSLSAANARTLDVAALAPLGVKILKVPVNQSPAVEFAEPNYLVQIADTLPNDPGWSSQYGPINIQAPQAWDITTGSSSVVIAVIDTGVDLGHPDLAAKIWNNPGETGGGKATNGLDDDGDGYVDNWRGWDFVNGDNTPQDDLGHGTHVAGIAAAASNNGVGIAGVAWGARVMALKVLNSGGGGSDSNVAAAMMWAADHGARVINLSLGGGPSSLMEDAVNYAYVHGVTVVAAAGNAGSLGVLYPAAYDNALAVASTNASNNRSSFSNYGPEIDLAAPGSSIYSTYWNGGSTYATLSGTSMATPHVAGVAALLAGLPQFDTPDKIRIAMETTALDLGDPGWDQFYGFGLVQARNALLFDPSTITPTPTPPPPIPYAVTTSLTCPPGATFNWLDATGGTNTNITQDDGYLSVLLPFNFIFNGQTKTNVLISANGYLTFGNIGYAYSNVSIPALISPNDFIAPFWDDLNPGAGGGIFYATFGSAPNRRFVVEWNSVPRFSPNPPYGEGALTFEAVLAEGSNDILFQYQTLTGPNATGESATVGIEYSTGASGALYAYNTPGSLQEGMAIRFSPIASGPTPTPAPTCAPTVLWVYYFPIVGK